METFGGPKRMPNKKLLFSLFVILVIFCNGLHASATCKRGCPVSDRGVFHYKPGSVYTYNFDSVVTITVAGTHADETSLTVQGRANLFAEPNCGYTLKLDGVKVTGKGVPRKLTAGIDKPVQFTMTNGELETQLCTNPADTDYSLNLKRAIISMLQRTDKAYETDIFGVCPTTTSTTKNGNIELVTKIRNLNACKYREALSNGFVSGLVNERAGIKSTPLLMSEYSQEQEIADGIIEHVELHEEYKFVPLANSQTGAGVRTRVRTTLKRTKTAAGSAPALNGGIPQTIIFRNPRPVAVENMDVMRTVLEQTIKDMEDHTSPKSAQQLTELIRLMRAAGQQQLTTLYRDVRSGTVHPSKDLARKIYLDALFRTGTDDAVATVIKFIESELSEHEKRLAYLSFNLVENVEEKSLEAINSLLDKNPPKEAYLSIGHLVTKYCRANSCHQNRVVQAISGKFAAKLNNCQAQTRKQETDVVSVLKGIQNAPFLAGHVVDRLIQCTAAKHPARIRVAALQTLQSASCDSKTQNAALQLLKNRNEDSEIRIEAYLALVECPSATLAEKIAEIVNSEPVYQVGGFITSHLRGIRDSTDPSREAARHHFSNIRLTKKFPIDPRRYSFNQELSYSFESLGIGASADQSVIYSQRGFLPRSYRLNLTAEIFGHDFNLFEFNGRQENFETLMEHYFGPKGFFTERSHEAPENRSKRSVGRDSLNAIAQRYKQYGQSENKNLLLDYSIKMFGNELAFLSLGEEIPQDSDTFTQKIKAKIDEQMDQLKNFEYNCDSHSMFIDSELIYPTGMGMPLAMVAQGVAIGKLQVATNIDLHNIVETYKNGQYRIKFVPSVNVDLNALMKIDAQVLSTGLRVRGSLHTSTGSDITVKITDGRDINVDIEMPSKKQDIISYSHDVEFIVEDPTKEAIHVPIGGKRTEQTERCFDQLALFGLTVCAVASGHGAEPGALSYPLNGPARFALRLETEKKIQLNLASQQSSGKYLYKVVYDTPGSQQPHRTELTAELGTDPKFYGRVSFKHPQKFLALEAGLQNDERELVVYGQYDHDRDVSTAKFGFKKTAPNEYEPLISIKGKDKTLDNIAGYRAAGKIVATDNDKGKRFDFHNVQLIDPVNRATTLNGHAEFNPAGGIQFATDMKIRNPENKEYDVKAKYVIRTGHIIAKTTVMNGVNPSASGSFGLELQHREGYVKNDLTVGYGEQLRYSYELHNEISYEPDKTKPRSAKFQNSFVSKEPSAKLKLNGQYSPNVLEYDFDANFRKSRVASTLNLKRNQKQDGDFDADFMITLNQHRGEIKAKRTLQDGNVNIDNTLKTSFGTRGFLKGKYSHRMTAVNGHVDFQGEVQFTDKDQPIGLIVTYNASPKSTTGTTKVTRGGAEIVTVTGNYVRGENPTGKFDITIKDLLVGKSELKASRGGQEGDFTALVNLKKLGRKIKLDSKYTIAVPTYNVDATVYYDYEKDNDKKITLTTKNRIERHSVDSNSALQVGPHKYTSVVKGQHDGGFLDGTTTGTFQLGLPDGRQLSGELDRKVTRHDDASDGYIKMKLLDRQADGKHRSLAMDAQVNGFNPKARLFDIDHKFTYVNVDGKTGVIEAIAKHMPKGEFKMAEGKIVVGGTLVDRPMEVSVTVDEYSKEHAVYRSGVKYGDLTKANLNGNYHVGGYGKPATYELQVNVDAPKTDMKTYQLETSGSLLRPESDDGVYEGKIHWNEHIGQSKFKLDGSAKGNAQHGSCQFEYDVPKMGPGKFEGSFVRDEKSDQGKYQMNMVYDYGQSRVIKMNMDAGYIEDKSATFHVSMQTPNENARSVEVTFKGEKSDARTYNGHLQMIQNGKSYGVNTVTVLSDLVTSADITVEIPGRTSKFYGSLERLGDHKGRTKLQIKNFGDFSFDGSGEVTANSLEDFYFRADANSPKLKLDHVHIEANPLAKAPGKGVEFKVTQGGKNVMSGSAEYNVKREKTTMTIEGQGNVQIYDKPRQANFKLVRQMYELGRDSEVGYSVNFNGQFGPRNVIAEFKATNKNFVMKLAECEDKKQCANIEVRSISQMDKAIMQHKLSILADLRSMGVPHEFELQSKIERIDYRIEQNMHIKISAQDNVQYELETYIRQKESAIILKTPKRKIALENVHHLPDAVFGRYETSSTLYLNKDRNPDEKSTLSFKGELSHVEKSAINAHGRLVFEHPNVKPLSISGSIDLNSDRRLAQSKFEFDLFKRPGQKVVTFARYEDTDRSSRGVNITTEASVRSEDGQFEYGIDGHTAASLDRYELSMGGSITTPHKDLRTAFLITASPKAFELSTIAFNEPVLTASGTVSAKDSELQAQYTILGVRPVVLKAKSSGLSSLSFEVERKDLYKIEGKIQTGKEATMVVRSGGSELFNGRVSLEPAHFLSTEYKVNDEDVKNFGKRLEEQVKADAKQSRGAIEQRFNMIRDRYRKQVESLKDSMPDMSGIQQTYERNIKEIADELSADPALKDIVEFYKRIFEAISQVVGTITKSLGETYQKFSEVTKDLYEQVSKMFIDQILPVIQKTAENILTILSEAYAENLKLLTGALETIAKTLKTFEADFNRIGKVVADFFKQFSGAYTKLMEMLQKEFDEVAKTVRELIDSLPGYEQIKATIEKYVSNMEGIKQTAILLNDLLTHVEDFLPTDEFKKFAHALHAYLEQKIKQDQVNDVESLKNIYMTLIAAIRSLLMQFKAQDPSASILLPIPFSMDVLRQIPVFGTMKFSVLNFLRNEHFASMKTILTQGHPRYLQIPFEMRAHIADGEHIFTFDGRHMTFPGTCAYVLVQDLDNRFSVVASLQAGKMASVTLTDKNNMVELLPGGQMKLNGKQADYPIHHKDMHAFRHYRYVSAVTEYGVEVKCSVDLRVCHVHVSGYYTGKTRGILGNGNNEPYDDFTLPNGKIAENYAEFGNAYTVTTGCAPVPSQDHASHGHHKQSDPVCRDIFGTDSGLMLAYLFLDPNNWMEACNHAVEKASDKHDAACNIALTYASAAHHDHIPIELPEECLKCDQNRELGAEFETKTPAKKADIVLVVDTDLQGSELVQGVMTDLRTNLQQRDIGDVHITVIAYNDNMRYPQLLTSDGALDFKGRFDKVDFSGVPRFDDRIKTGIRHLPNTYLDKIERLASDLIAPPDARAFNLAMEYPFRSDANRAVIAIRNDQLEYSNMLKLVGAAWSNEMAKYRGIALHLIGPVKEFALTGRANQQGNVVGFDRRTAIMLGDAKKRVNIGSADIRNLIKYSSDMGVDFVQDDGGYVFVIQNYEAMKDKPKERKQFTMAIGAAISDQLSRTEITFDCECQQIHELVAGEHCEVREQNLIAAQQRKPAARG